MKLTDILHFADINSRIHLKTPLGYKASRKLKKYLLCGVGGRGKNLLYIWSRKITNHS